MKKSIQQLPFLMIVFTLLIYFSASVFAQPGTALQLAPGDEEVEPRFKGKKEKLAAASLVRMGFSGMGMLTMMDADLDYYYDEGLGGFIDYLFYRKRGTGGNGFDLYTRFTCRHFSTSDEIKEWEDDYVYEDNYIQIYSLDAGVRVIYGAYFFRQFWQVYALLAPRVLYYRAVGENSRYGEGHPDNTTTLGSLGFIGGMGFEVTFTHFMGMFFEFNVGYCPVGES
ncbi:MAG: hypothetical protein ACOCX9_06655, partial [Spirochaetota bacterium]